MTPGEVSPRPRRREETRSSRGTSNDATRRMEVELKTGEEVIIQHIKRITKNERRIDRAVEKALRNEEKEWEREEGMITWKN